MSYSNLISSKSLRKANAFLLSLNFFIILLLIAAVVATHNKWLPGFANAQWFTITIAASYFFFFAVCGSIFIYAFIYCWQLNNSWSFLLAGLLLACLFVVWNIWNNNYQYLSNSIVLIIWFACFSSLLLNILRNTGLIRDLNINLLLTITLSPLFILASIFCLSLTFIYHPRTQDELLMAIDATLGISPSFLAGQLFLHLPLLLTTLIKFIYLALPCLLAVIYIARYLKEQKPPLELVIEFFLIGASGMLLYHIITGCGPINAFKPFWPQQIPVPQVPQERLCIGGFLPRNCLPSLHIAWCICLWRHSRRCHRYIRLLTSIWVCGTLAGTLGLGEHYLVDLLVGFGLATCVGGLCAIDLSWQCNARRYAVLGGGLLCLTWYLIIMFGLNFLRISPLLAWGCYLASIFISVGLELNLSKAQKLINTNNI